MSKMPDGTSDRAIVRPSRSYLGLPRTIDFRAPSGSRLTLLAAALLLACNARPLPPDDEIPPEVRAYARARCQTLETCGCESDAYQGRAECEGAVIAIYTEYLADDETLDLSCFESAARSWSDDLCADPILDPPCDVIEPTHPRGQWCSDLDLLRDPFARVPWCAEGLVCWNGTCVEPSTERQEGEPCSPDGLCGSSELVCFEGRCEPPHLEGEPCEAPSTCAHGPGADLYCTSGLCVDQKDDGESCQADGECLSSLCIAGRCTTPPALVCFSAQL